MDREQQLREEICEVGRCVWTRGMASANSGNISVRLNDDEVLITPTLVSKGFMRPQQILAVDLDGQVLRGEGYPTSETPMHLSIYRKKREIGAVVHSHPPRATAFAVAGIPLDLHLVPEAVIFLGEVPLVPFHFPGSTELAESILPYLPDYDAVLLENHGALAWGTDLMQAYHRMETVEFCAEITFTAQLLGGARELPPDASENLLNIRKMMKGK
jgi:L-fuculose-phosphate aldolase